ncbi:protein phosphatase PHLPP-like protein isoform X2 [Cylas formicarius]|uniref:protein phosphatase PHLPP-like protein isoform X2 n=1 Tax=Cylas formicarius TaxID=197179 RepID=UPI002958B0D8|nr:protein phosphatase PHLPP-like protein isoform X2 [Cylas formicarius]
MIAAWGASKKSAKFIGSFAGVRDCDADSLEDGIPAGNEDEAERDVATGKNGGPSVKHLNLNNLCKKRGEINQLHVEEIVLPGDSLRSLSELQILSLRGNGIQNFPTSVLQLTSLVTLDISDNCLVTLPPEISQLRSLRELIADQNLLSVLPATIWDLQFLKTLRAAVNRLAGPPDMRTVKSPDCDRDGGRKIGGKTCGELASLNLRANRLKGHIILGNYSCLTELDVSENRIDNLDLGSVEGLRVLRCSRNCLVKLTLYGQNLVSVIAGNNRLKTFETSRPPTNLTHLDLSYNELESLPEWLPECRKLRVLFAANNALASLPDRLFSDESPFLETVQLAYNRLQRLPQVRRELPVREMFLQNNSLSSLPDDFFRLLTELRVLNLSNNRLVELPPADAELPLEKLFVTANCLRSLDRVAPRLRNIKVLHAAYNNLSSVPDGCAAWWRELDELVLSGNKIGRLPEDVVRLQRLAVLRVHSNALRDVPALSQLTELRVLDLAHNHLDRVDLPSLIPPNLKFLDLSCNANLHVDGRQFNAYRTQRPMSLVDVSGMNRTSLPLTPRSQAAFPPECSPFCEDARATRRDWSVGFSETPGRAATLRVAQVRLPAFCNTEALLGLFDGENGVAVPPNVDKLVPRVLLEERTVKETAHEYMKYAMLAVCRQLNATCLNAVLVHVLKSSKQRDFGRGHVMKVASVGDARLVLAERGGRVATLPKKRSSVPTLNRTIPDPDLAEIELDERHEFAVMANKKLWDVMTAETAVAEVARQRNVVLAAKRLQDLAQSYGADENLSVVVVRFDLGGGASDVDLLMRELRQTIGDGAVCRPGCCCDGDEEAPLPPPPMAVGDDKSLASGCGDCNSSSKAFFAQIARQNDGRLFRSVAPAIFEAAEVKASPERRSYRGVAKALRQRRDEERNREDSDSGVSEEQFKCWEYMLERNTQKLFDKELDTLGPAKNGGGGRQSGVKLPAGLSRSSPHLECGSGQNNRAAVRQLTFV